tara:strand:+ start:708 stop:1055 length:348 start_codon:yes stop_codon:yes gene_type:complete
MEKVKKKKEFISNVTGEIWHKENSKKWSRVINHVGVISEDIVSTNKDGSTTTLVEGSEVFIDDIRGRINPQYRVKDESGKIWFVPVSKIEVLENENSPKEVDLSSHSYRGVVRKQ